jgi:cytochrome c-type biogenesis protein CcmH
MSGCPQSPGTRPPAPLPRCSPTRRAHRRLLRGATTLALAAISAVPVCAAGAMRASQPTIERNVMCVTCKIPLDEAQSLQASRERELIRGLIAAGRDEAQIKATLVGQYGPAVLAMPSAKGLDAAVYIVPVAVLILLLALLAVLLPSWRRRAGASEPETFSSPASISPGDADRLNADLARFD